MFYHTSVTGIVLWNSNGHSSELRFASGAGGSYASNCESQVEND